MARMSIDDKFLRDARVVLLGRRFGWGRRETMGALLDVFALTYDQETDTLSTAEVDAASGEAGFALAMIAVGLADPDAGDSARARIKGAADRIEYLVAKREAGRKGGRKSGESRRNKDEAKRSTASSTPQARGNPPDPVPDVVPDPVPVPDQIPDPPPARAIPPVVVRAEPEQDTGHPEPPIPPPITLPVAWSGPPDHRALADRRKLAAEIRDAVNAARDRVAGELGERALPLLAQDPGEGSLANWILEQPDLEVGKKTLLRIVAMAEVEAVAKRGLQWLTLSAIFSPRNATRFAGGTAAEFARKPAKARDMASVIATPAEMDTARLVLKRLSDDSGIPWRVEDGHAALVVDRLRELARDHGDPVRAELELLAVVTDRGDEWAAVEKMRKNLCPSTVFGDRFTEYLARARKAYGADIAASISDEQRKAGA